MVKVLLLLLPNIYSPAPLSSGTDAERVGGTPRPSLAFASCEGLHVATPCPFSRAPIDPMLAPTVFPDGHSEVRQSRH